MTRITRPGLEGLRKTQGKRETALFSKSGAESGARQCLSGANWAEICDLILACDELPPAAKKKLIAIGGKEIVFELCHNGSDGSFVSVQHARGTANPQE